MVDDQEEVQIFPARPIYDEREYAGREENNEFAITSLMSCRFSFSYPVIVCLLLVGFV